MDTFILILNLSVGIIGIVLIWLGYHKDKTSDPKAKGILAKRIVILASYSGNIKMIVDEIGKSFIYGMTTIFSAQRTLVCKQCVRITAVQNNLNTSIRPV